MIDIGSPVKIIRDRTSYTAGCYQWCSGVVMDISPWRLPGIDDATLYFVLMDSIPLDDYGMGGWWYTEAELRML